MIHTALAGFIDLEKLPEHKEYLINKALEACLVADMVTVGNGEFT